MSTGSSKSNRKRQAKQPAKEINKANAESPRVESSEVSERVYTIASIGVFCVGAFLRLYNLKLVPLHHDEGVNGNFLVRLVREGAYQYDPANYHGPSLYYFSAIIPWVCRFLFGLHAQNTYGLNTVTIRLVTALFGLGTILLVLMLRNRIGTIGALSAAALLSISPGAVYLSRYFIHETLFVFFTLGVIVASLKFYEDTHPVYLILAAASLALLFATKETFIINAPVLLIALISTRAYLMLRKSSARPRSTASRQSRGSNRVGVAFRDTIEKFGGPTTLILWALIATAVFVFLSVLFYSSFFTNFPKGVYDSLKTFDVWTKTGQTAHVHPVWKYVQWLVLQESPLLILGSIGAVAAVWKPRSSFGLFAAFWAFGTLAAYSLVPYKTPWIALNFIVPLTIVSGYALQTIYEASGKSLQTLISIGLLAVVVSGYQMIDLNFINYDNDDEYYVYVYAHSRREMLNLVDQINHLAQVTGEGGQMGVTIVSPDYWPLPWYFRDYTRVGYYGRITASTEPVIIASEGQRVEIESTFGSRYQFLNSGLNAAGSFRLRPGVELLLYVRRDLVR